MKYRQPIALNRKQGTIMIRVAMYDDHPLIRQGLHKIIDEVHDITVCAEGRHGREALAAVRKEQCDVILLDINLPDQNGIDVLRTIKLGQPRFPVLIFTSCPAQQYALNTIKMGADGYLEKSCEVNEIPVAIRRVASGHRYISREVGELVANSFRHDTSNPPHLALSDREFQVFLHLCQGETVTNIAQELCLSVKTISTYRARVMDKMEMQSNSELTYYAMKHDLIT
jgi:DNA-binding NarL/FixJ family response regulator